MAFASGLSGQLVVGTESTYGTRVTPDHSLEFNTSSLALSLQRLIPSGIRAGQQFARGSRSVQTTRDVNGDVVLEVPSVGYGVILNQLHGNTVVPSQIATSGVYTQTHAIGSSDPTGKSLTIQTGVPDTGSTPVVRPIEFTGCKITQSTWAVDTGGYLVATHTIDGRNMDTTQTLVTPTYSATQGSFDFIMGSVLTNDGAGGSYTAVGNVTAASITVGQPMKTDRFFLSTSGLKGTPIPNAFATGTATLSAEFQSLADVTRFVNNTSFGIKLLFEGPVIGTSGTNKSTFEITCPLAKADGPSPALDGTDVVNMEIPAVIFHDGTNAPVTVRYLSTDTTL